MPWQPRLWRLARRLETAYARRRSSVVIDRLPSSAWQRVLAAERRSEQARRYGWLRAERRQREALARELDFFIGALRTFRNELAPRLPRAPTAGELYAELAAARREFGELRLDQEEIYVVTDSVTLEGIELGPFEIRLNLAQLDCPEPYRIVAVEPHPASSCSETTHPHVHGERLCLGEGKGAARAALTEGRLYDLFQLLERILQTYGEGSAYVPLERWYGVPCSDCADTVDEDDAHRCQDCEAVICGGCVWSCEFCERPACRNCASGCARCAASVCSRCLGPCDVCEEDICPACREEGTCDACRPLQPEEPESVCRNADSVPAAAVAAATPLHADGVGEAAVLARSRHHRNRRLRNLGRR
jgi:hypothetical protein